MGKTLNRRFRAKDRIMADYPTLPLFTDAFIADTVHLDAAQTGAYIMLLMCAWRTADCRLPNDDDKLARFARCTPRQWLKIKAEVLQFWTLKDNFWQQKRLSETRVYVTRNVQQKREAGARGGKANALKNKKTPATDATAPPVAEHQHTGSKTQASKTKSESISKNIPNGIWDPAANLTAPEHCPHPKLPDQDLPHQELPNQNGALVYDMADFGAKTEAKPPTLSHQTPAEGKTPEQQVVELWNTAADRHKLCRVAKLSKSRADKLKQQLAHVGIEGFERAMEIIGRSDFLLGQKPDSDWVVHFDFLLKTDTKGNRLENLLAGAYGGVQAVQTVKVVPFEIDHHPPEWQKVLSGLVQRYGEDTARSWFHSVTPQVSGTVVTVAADRTFTMDTIQSKFDQDLTQLVRQHYGPTFSTRFDVQPRPTTAPEHRDMG